MLLLLVLALLGLSSAYFEQRLQRGHGSVGAYTGCPTNNVFYYHGEIASPFYPASYPPDTKCYYFITGEIGKVLEIKFDHYDLETCCDYVTIYDGATISSKILAQIGGPKSNITKPAASYITTTRNAVVTFQSNKLIQQSGFHFVFNSTTTVSPCNRDIVLVIDGKSGLGSQENFQKQLDFIANTLTPTWNVGLDKIRVMINLQSDIDYAVVWRATDIPTNDEVSETVKSLTDFIPDVLANNNTDLECMMRYTYNAFGSFGEDDLKERYGIEQVAIVFISENPHSEQDLYEAIEFAHKTKETEDTKVIIVGMNPDLDKVAISKLAYAKGYAFFADYDNLSTLVDQINHAICNGLNEQCGP